jgi:hypothetical protein
MGKPRTYSLLCVAAASAVCLVLAGCSSSSSSNGASTPASTPAGSTPSSTFTPASGTADTGQLFQPYTSKAGGYSMVYPGGWRVAGKDSDVRIARFGNAITVVVRPRDKQPYYKGYQQQLEALLAKKQDKLLSSIVQPAKEVKLDNGDKVTMAVIEQKRPTGPGSDAPEDTLVVYRYLFWKNGKLLQLSLSSVKGIDNAAAWNLIANSVKWS